MKIELTETSVKFIAETPFETETLKRLRERGVESLHFEDDWNYSGSLVLQHHVHPWDRVKG